MKFHLTPKGEAKPCRVKTGTCPFGAVDEHFPTATLAAKAYEKSQLSNVLPTPAKSSEGSFENVESIRLTSNFGDVDVVNGDLSSSDARVALTSGLCADFALAVHDKSGSDLYFVSYDDSLNEANFIESFEEEPEIIFDLVTHVLAQSKSSKRAFIDAYGHKTKKEVQDFYGDDITIVKGNRAIAEYFSTKQYDLSKFAESALILDKEKRGYDYEYIEA